MQIKYWYNLKNENDYSLLNSYYPRYNDAVFVAIYFAVIVIDATFVVNSMKKKL